MLLGFGRRRVAALLLMVASGFAGLGYQIVWTQQCALWLGHESAAVLAVVAAFFGGLAVGALALGAHIEASAQPVRWYAGCELAIALWSVVLSVAMPTFSCAALRLMGAQPSPVWQWLVAFGGTFLGLLPATAAMGATLPAMERLTATMARGASGEARSLAGLYAGNTLGAVLGVLATAFWLVPALGLARTVGLCTACNVSCGVTALVVFRSPSLAPARPTPGALRAHGIPLRLAATGLLGIGYEVVVVRVLGQVSENTVYTFALLLAVYLLGSAVGAAAYQRRQRVVGALPVGDALLAALAAACLLGTATLWFANGLKTTGLRVLGNGLTAAVLAEAIPAVCAFGPPTLIMGALFSHLGQRAHASGISFGRALGVNTLGAAAAPALFGVLLVPALGSKATLLLLAVGYVALIARRSWFTRAVAVPAGGTLALAVGLFLFAPPLSFIDVPDGGRVLFHQEGTMAAVSVVQDADGIARLRINNRQQEGSSATGRVDGRQAWLPLLLHPGPRRALFLGLGTGTTASAAAEDPTLQVDVVELLPEVIAASAEFARLAWQQHDNDAASRLHVLTADARRYVRASPLSYDVIVSDNFHPARSGSGALYTVEHFQAVRLRLAPAGLFCQWLPLHQLELDTVRSIVQAFLMAFPHGAAVLASNSLETPVLGLVGRRDGARFDSTALAERHAHASLPQRLSAMGFEDALSVLGTFVAGPQALRRFAAGAPINSDDHPVVAYRAPRITYAPDSSPRDRLLALLGTLSLAPNELLLPMATTDGPARLQAYWRARDRFVVSGRDVRPSPRVTELLAQVREPLLAVLRISPDFRPAYDPLLAMAVALRRFDVSSARALLTDLARLAPDRPEATRALNANVPGPVTVDTTGR